MIRLIQGDCIEEMRKLAEEDVKIDLVLTDPPYGTINNLSLDGWKTQTTEWDNQLPTKEMFDCCEKLLRVNGKMILFSQEPYTSHLRNYNYRNISFLYPLYWLKNHFANSLSCKKAPVSYVEDLSVFKKNYDMCLINPLRRYAQRLLCQIEKDYNINKRQIYDCIDGNLNHFFSDSGRFNICKEKTYNELIHHFNINTFDFFIEYGEMYKINNSFKSENSNVFNLKGAKFKSNVLEYKKPYNNYHPTEKPVDLLKDLILTYTDNDDLVLDFTMGSGSTGVACLETNRNFIGIELDEDYYNIAKQRCSNFQSTF